MNFLIAGCGIGGLSAAHALVRQGHQVRLLERSGELKPVGAGISLQPNAMQALRRLGLDGAVSEVAWDADQARIQTWNGKLLTRFDFSKYQERFGFLPKTIFRGDLIRVLAETLDRSHAEMVLGESLKSYVESADKITVTTCHGKSYQCDALVGADGIHSAVRTQLWGESPPKFAGYTCWRGMVHDPNLVTQVETMTEVWGNGSRCGYMRCNPRQVYWFATQNRRSRSDHETDPSWKSCFQSWISPIPELLMATPQNEVVHNDIMDRNPVFPWGRGNVTLLGDAAHAMTPNFGQGGAQAIEDAVVLGLAMKGSGDVESALRKFESARRSRTHSMVKGSRQFGRIGQAGNWFSRLIRNRVMPNLPRFFVDGQLAKQCDFEAYLKKSGMDS